MNDITASLATAREAHSQQAGQDVQSKLAGLSSSKLSPEAKDKKLREACEGFESIFIQKMWQEMRKSVHQTTLLHGKEEQFWQDMYDQELAKKMTSAGGIGLANMMYEQLSSHLTSASRSTAQSMAPQNAFVPTQAPLMGNALSQNASIPLTDTEAAFSQPAKFGESLYEKAESVAEAQPASGNSQNRDKSAQVSAEVKKPVSEPQASTSHVDPSVASALSSMRANVEHSAATQAVQPDLASVSYAEPMQRQQPVASGLEMANAVRRQAGDQLGSRGVREPLLPQTRNARTATEQAQARREARNQKQAAAREAQARQPLPYSFPRGQAEAAETQSTPSAPQTAPAPLTTGAVSETQAAWLAPAEAEVFAPMEPVVDSGPSPVVERSLDPKGANAVTTQRNNLLAAQRARAERAERNAAARRTQRTQPARKDQEIKTLNISPQRAQEPAQTSSQIPPAQANLRPQNASAQSTGLQAPQAPETAAPAAENSSAASAYTIPPLTAQELKS